MIPLTPLGGACRRRHLVTPTADKRHIWRMRPCGLISGHAWEVCLVVWVRVELYTLPGHSSRCNRKETETHVQGAASATTRKKQKQRQKWINNSNKETAIRIVTMLNILIAPERKRRIGYGVHLLTVAVLLPICKTIRCMTVQALQLFGPIYLKMWSLGDEFLTILAQSVQNMSPQLGIYP